VFGFGGISLADLTFRSGRVSNGDDGLLCFIQGVVTESRVSRCWREIA
jgi:hypothetical protein